MPDMKCDNDITGEIIVEMMEKIDDAAQQELGCRLLSQLAIENENKLLISQEGGVETIISAMKRHIDHTSVQKEACTALSHLTHHNIENINTVPSDGGIDSLVCAMKHHSSHGDIQEEAFKALYNLACDDENKDLISHSGAIELIVGAMKTHVNHVGVQREACRTLRNFIYHHSENNLMISRIGGINAIIDTMRSNLSQADIQTEALKALYNLACEDNNRVQISRDGAIEVIVESMKQNVNCAEVQKQGCKTIYNLIMNDDNKIIFLNNGGIQVIIRVMRGHTNDLDVLNEAFKLIRTVSHFDVESTKRLINAGTIRMITSAMKINYGLSTFQTGACKALTSLTNNYLQNRINLGKEDGAEWIPVIINVMKENRNSLDVQREICKLLNNLVTSRLKRVAVLEENGVPIIVSALESYLHDFRLQKEACLLLDTLCLEKSIRRIIVHSGGIELIVRAMSEFAKSISLVEIAFRLLLTFSTNQDYRLIVSNENIIKAITDGMELHIDNINFLLKAFKLLKNLSFNQDNRLIIVHHGMKFIIEGMDRYKSSEELQEEGCKVLYYLVIDENFSVTMSNHGNYLLHIGEKSLKASKLNMNPQACVSLSNLMQKVPLANVQLPKKDIMIVVNKAMSAYPKNKNIQVTGCDIMFRFSLNLFDNNITINRGGGIYCIINAMRRHLACAEVQRAVCRVLCNLSVYEHNATVITRCDGIELIIKTIRLHKGDKDIQTKAWKTLGNLTSHRDEFKKQVVEQGGIDSIVSAAMTNSRDDEFFEKAQKTLRRISVGGDSNDEVIQKMKMRGFFKKKFYNFS